MNLKKIVAFIAVAGIIVAGIVAFVRTKPFGKLFVSKLSTKESHTFLSIVALSDQKNVTVELFLKCAW